MTNRTIIRVGLNWIAGFLSFAVLGYGLYSVLSVDLRFNPVLSTLYSVLPLASFPVFLVGFLWRRAAIVQAVLILAYLPVCTVLSLRMCSSLGYCAGISAAVFVNLESRQFLTFLGAAIASLGAMMLADHK
jgi:hypothetical protein